MTSLFTLASKVTEQIFRPDGLLKKSAEAKYLLLCSARYSYLSEIFFFIVLDSFSTPFRR